jgi:hypothetical protein
VVYQIIQLPHDTLSGYPLPGQSRANHFVIVTSLASCTAFKAWKVYLSLLTDWIALLSIALRHTFALVVAT